MTSSEPDQIVIEREVPASPMAVFQAWVQPESFARWFGGAEVSVPLDKLDFVAEAGRAWTATMVLPNGHTIDWAGSFVEVTPPQRLVFTITDRPTEPTQAPVTVDLVPITGGTQMRMTQQTPGFTPEQQVQLVAGWGTFLDVLAGQAIQIDTAGSH